MFLRLFQVFLEAVAQILRSGSLGHFGEGLHELIFSAVEVFQFLDVKMPQTIGLQVRSPVLFRLPRAISAALTCEDASSATLSLEAVVVPSSETGKSSRFEV